MKKIFILTGSSASGKTSVAEELIKKLPLERVITTTSRPARPGEKNGRDYYFVAPAVFKAKIKKGDFLEWVEFAGHFYGSGKAELKRIERQRKFPLFVIDPRGAKCLKQLWRNQAVMIFLAVGKAELKRRLLTRPNITAQEVKGRLAYFESEKKVAKTADFLVANPYHHFNQVVARVKRIIASLL
jgi:guanylate kinase